MTFNASASSGPAGPPEPVWSCSKLAALLDTRLERRLGPVLVRWLYVGSLVLIAAVTLFAMLMSWWLASWAGGALGWATRSQSRVVWCGRCVHA
jgi:hypothetical protein